MAEVQRFRSAVNGFNRNDVADFIDFLNKKHNAQVNQMRTEMEELRSELTIARQTPAHNSKLEAELEAANQRCAELEIALAAVSAQLEQAKSGVLAAESLLSAELEAYRRAERTERIANERAKAISTQATGVLADATARVDETSAQLSEMAEMIAEKLSQFRDMMIASRTTLRDAATAMHAIRPERDDL